MFDNPSSPFVRVPAFCPSVQRLEDLAVYIFKGVLGKAVSVIVGPAPHFGVEYPNQITGCYRCVLLDNCSEISDEREYVSLYIQGNESAFFL